MGVSACICSLDTEQSICVPRHVCVGGCVGVKVVQVHAVQYSAVFPHGLSKNRQIL